MLILLVVRTLRSFRGHLMNKDNHLVYYVPGSLRNNKIDVVNHGNVAGTLDDNFKMASNSTHNVHYVTSFILVHGPDIPPVNPPHQERMIPILFCSWDLSGYHHHQIGMDYLWDAIFKKAAIEISEIKFSPITQFLG